KPRCGEARFASCSKWNAAFYGSAEIDHGGGQVKDKITSQQYLDFQNAFDFFNAELFGGALPQVLVTLQRHARARGYFSPERFHGRGNKTTIHEIALNPDCFCDSSDEYILSTLVHEQAHLWQQAHGNPPRRCYHDKEWAAKMKEIGLQP